MKGFYNLTEELKTALLAEPFCNTVTTGSLDDVDLNKQTIYPLGHIIVNNCTVATSVLTFNVSVLCMDIVDVSKKFFKFGAYILYWLFYYADKIR